MELPTVILTSPGGEQFFIHGDDPTLNQEGVDLTYTDETTLVMTLTPAYVKDMPTGSYTITVVNPNESQGELVGALEVVLGPTLKSVDPTVICDELDTTLTLSGQDFRDGATVIIGDTPLPEEDVTFVDASTIEAIVRAKTIALGLHDVTVMNPEGCISTLSQALEVVPPPTLESVDPDTVCSNGQVVLTGTGFREGATVTIGPAERSGSAVSVDSETQITVNIGQLAPGGPYDVTVTNVDGCSSDTLVGALTVVLGPTIVAVDPNVVYNAVDFPVAIFGSGFGTDATALTVELLTTPPTELIIISVTDQRIDALVPKGIDPGTYDLRISVGGCAPIFENAITVTDQLTVNICGIDPPFGYTGERTAVTITSGTNCPSGGDQQFVSTPRAWLNVNGTLTALKAVAFVTSESLTGTVPEGLAVGGPYDLLVQNPDGSIGQLEDAFEVVSLPIPIITAISPGTVDTGFAGTLTISGTDFRDPITVQTIDVDGNMIDLTSPTVNTDQQATAGLDVGAMGLMPGAYVIRLTNTDQGTYSEFSALAVTNPSGNLGQIVPWEQVSDMNTARRRHALVPGRVSQAARFLYVIGGDSGGGTPAPLDSVELVPLDKFGNTGTWVTQRYTLNTARSGVGAVIQGPYLYVIGGEDANGPLASVERAVILDPADAPEIDTFSFTLGGDLKKGAWIYRVSAVMPATHADNPGGESLPSDPVVIHAIDNVTVSLSWNVVDEAVSYNIYRSPVENSPYGEERLLAEGVTGTTFEDDGSQPILNPNQGPLIQGCTGVFVQSGVSALNTARSDAAAKIAEAGGQPYVYVTGGRSAATTVENTVELAVISGDGADLGAFSPGASSLLDAREHHMLVVGDNATSPLVPAGETYLFVAGGSDGTAIVKGGSSSLLGSDGEPGAWTDVAQIKNATTGAMGYLVNDTFYYFGGSSDGTNATDAGISCKFSNPPSFVNCNSLSGNASLLAPRVHGAITLESAFFYLAGGGDTTTTASQTVYKIVY
jgi:hypothetical protein